MISYQNLYFVLWLASTLYKIAEWKEDLRPVSDVDIDWYPWWNSFIKTVDGGAGNERSRSGTENTNVSGACGDLEQKIRKPVELIWN